MEYQICCGRAKAIVNTLGAELTSFNRDEIEYIWTGNADYWSGHSPVLFPTVGSLKNNQTEINGTKYNLKKHGFARRSEFDLVELSEEKAVFSLKANDMTKEVYPFEFELIVTHTIFENGFKTEYKVINDDSKDILFGIGGHAGINCPLYSNTAFTDYYIEYEQKEDGPFYYTKVQDCGGIIYKEDRIYDLEGKKQLMLDYSLFDKDVIIIEKMKSKKIRLLNSKNSSGIEFSMDGFNSMGIWTPAFKKAPFICIEPWSVTPDFSDGAAIFEQKTNITKLEQSKEKRFVYEMKII